MIDPPVPLNPSNWYWIVAGSVTQVYSSAAGDYVPVSNPSYLAWLAAGKIPTKIDSEVNLGAVLAQYGLSSSAVNVSDALKGSTFDNIPRAVQVWAFAVDNRVRVLEGQPTRTPAQFKTYVKGLL